MIYADQLRLNQVIDNVINNSYKYAETDIYACFSHVVLDEERNLKGLCIQIRDQGPGVPQEQLPLLTEKFYRGDNAEKKSGSGLGLYLSQLFMDQMKGGFSCYCDGGFVVELILQCV